jgi:hypothetical protein
MAKRTKRAKRATKLSKGVVGTVIAGTLTAAGAGSAGATTFNEPSIAGGDFSDTFLGADPLSPLSVGTNLVTGHVQGGSDENDFFKFSGLEGGAAFIIDTSATGGGDPTGEVLASDESVIVSGSLFGPGDLTGFVPDDGVLIFRAFNTAAQEGTNYEISLSAPLAAPVPAPSALALTGLGAAIAGAFTWRRRKRAR